MSIFIKSCYGSAYVADYLNVIGTKNFIQAHPTDTTKLIRYIAIEAGEAITLVRGIAKTSGGTSVVTLPEHFALVTSNDVPVTVLLTPENAPVLLYTSAKSKESITVIMKPSDYKEFGDAPFAWQVCGVRDGFENEEIISDIETFDNGSANDVPVSEKRAKINVRSKKMMEKLSGKLKQKNSR